MSSNVEYIQDDQEVEESEQINLPKVLNSLAKIGFPFLPSQSSQTTTDLSLTSEQVDSYNSSMKSIAISYEKSKDKIWDSILSTEGENTDEAAYLSINATVRDLLKEVTTLICFWRDRFNEQVIKVARLQKELPPSHSTTPKSNSSQPPAFGAATTNETNIGVMTHSLLAKNKISAEKLEISSTEDGFSAINGHNSIDISMGIIGNNNPDLSMGDGFTCNQKEYLAQKEKQIREKVKAELHDQIYEEVVCTYKDDKIKEMEEKIIKLVNENANFQKMNEQLVKTTNTLMLKLNNSTFSDTNKQLTNGTMQQTRSGNSSRSGSVLREHFNNLKKITSDNDDELSPKITNEVFYNATNPIVNNSNNLLKNPIDDEIPEDRYNVTELPFNILDIENTYDNLRKNYSTVGRSRSNMNGMYGTQKYLNYTNNNNGMNEPLYNGMDDTLQSDNKQNLNNNETNSLFASFPLIKQENYENTETSKNVQQLNQENQKIKKELKELTEYVEKEKKNREEIAALNEKISHYETTLDQFTEKMKEQTKTIEEKEKQIMEIKKDNLSEKKKLITTWNNLFSKVVARLNIEDIDNL